MREKIYERELYRTRTSTFIENLFADEIVREYRVENFRNYQEYLSEREVKRGYGQQSERVEIDDRNLQKRTGSVRKFKITRRWQKMDMKIENHLRNLRMSWITIAEAMSDENRNKTIQLIKQNPRITKEEFLREMKIEEIKY